MMRTAVLRLSGPGRRLASTDALKRTALYAWHEDMGGKMVDFAGYALPVQYDGLSIKQSHQHTREKASLFDVSHMGQLRIRGKDRAAFLERVVVGEIASLAEGAGRLSLITNENGGIKDDTVITNAGDYIYMVVNAACKDKDAAHLTEQLADFRAKGGDADFATWEGQSLLALQGPSSMDVLGRFVTGDLRDLAFMTGTDMEVDGIPCRVTRCGYTGEDGFEISVPDDRAVDLARKLCGEAEVEPAGLGARDSLRLEAGLCLYGNDMDETTSPVEATLLWTISKRRREEGGFLGAEAVQRHIAEGVAKKRVGFVVERGAPARQHARVLSEDGDVIGEVTSGSFGPTVNKAVGMAYVAPGFRKAGTSILVEVRGKQYPATVAKMPFTPAGYYK